MLRALVPSESPEGIIVYLHGGGWVVGDLDDFDTLGRFIATESNCIVVLVDYRLAPEHPFPAAINDAWAALQWVASNQHRIVKKKGAVLPLIVAESQIWNNAMIQTWHLCSLKTSPGCRLPLL
jgi:acetyl esterase